MNTNYENLPLLPLTSGVLLPGMVFTLALESDEAIAAVEAAEAADGNLVIVPFIDGRYASVASSGLGSEPRCPARDGPCGSRSSPSMMRARTIRPPSSWPGSTVP
jgi:hypothetical protein